MKQSKRSQKEVGQLSSQIEGYEKDSKSNKERVKVLENEKQTLEQKNSEIQTKLDNDLNELNDLKIQVQSLNNVIDKKSKEKKKTKKKYKKQKKKKKKEVGQLSSQIEGYEKE